MFICFFAVIISLILAVYRIYWVKSKKNRIIFLVVQYILCIFTIVSMTLLGRMTLDTRQMILTPLKSYMTIWNNEWDYSGMYVAVGIIGNILIFLPIGFTLTEHKKARLNKFSIIVVGLILSFVIECIQYIWKLGVFEVDDLIHNMFGTYIGAHLFCVLQKSEEKKLDHDVLKELVFILIYAINFLIICGKPYLEYISR